MCVCKSLSLSISSTTFSISLFLRYCYFSVSNLLAIFNRSHHHQKKPLLLSKFNYREMTQFFSLIHFWPYCFFTSIIIFFTLFTTTTTEGAIFTLFRHWINWKGKIIKQWGIYRQSFWWRLQQRRRRLWWRILLYIFYDVFNETHSAYSKQWKRNQKITIFTVACHLALFTI